METHHDASAITCYPASFRTFDDITPEIIHENRGAVYLLDADGTVPPPEIETRVKVFWNSSFLFVIFEGKFQELRVARALPRDVKTGESYLLYEHSDVYEAFIGPDARRLRRYKEFQVSPDSRWLDYDVRKDGEKVISDEKWFSGFRCRSIVDERQKTWDAVMGIPWKALGDTPLSKCEWNCNFYRASGKFHGDELL
ncbi:MAG: hypothetical protein KGJ59_10855, partial [Bacteroidota bacterium]|nr:hypothetical protein [Bacteroidota bacterium]